MPSLSPSFFSISDVKINLRFTVQKASPKIEDTLVSVNTEYLKQLPKSMISEISLDLIPKKNFKRKSALSSNKINKTKCQRIDLLLMMKSNVSYCVIVISEYNTQ